ncbi:MAG: ribonuclease Z [Myxococcales bacterium]|nr:ribonuclease Z [Myxococcales bacterium]
MKNEIPGEASAQSDQASLVFVGVGDATDPQHPNTSLWLDGAHSLLLDCGYSVPQAFWQHCTDPNRLDGIWLSHGHADHCFGLPGLLLWMRTSGRTKPLHVLSAGDVQPHLKQVLELGYPGSFAPEKCFELIWQAGPRQLHTWQLSHAQTSHSVSNHAVRIDTPSWSVAYSGDGGMTAESRALFSGVSVLVHECHDSQRRGMGHTTIGDLTQLARGQPETRVFGIHHRRDERHQMERELRADGLVHPSRPGLHLTLPLPSD